MTEVERFRRFRAMCKAGKSNVEIANALGVLPQVVAGTRTVLGLNAMPGRRSKIRAAMWKRFARERRAGKSIKRAAELAGIKPQRAYKPPAWLEVA